MLGLIGWALGIDPRAIEGAETLSGNDRTQQQSDARSTASTGVPSDAMGQFVSAVLGSTEALWLHKQVMIKLAENDEKVPDTLKG
jgi:predicted metalloprotease